MGEITQREKVYTISNVPGVSRDPTPLDKSDYDEAVWCRFSQWGLPRKIGGYTRAFQLPTSTPRGMLTQSYNGTNYVVTGCADGIYIFSAGTSTISGTGPFKAQIAQGYGKQTIASVVNQTQFTLTGQIKYDFLFKVGTKILFNDPTSSTAFTVQTVSTTGTVAPYTTTITTTTAFTGTPTTVYVQGPSFTADARYQWTFDVIFDPLNQTQTLVAHGALTLQAVDNQNPTPVYFGPLLPNASGAWVLTPLADVDGANPTGNIITATNGVIALYPHLMVYGASGQVSINNVNTIYSMQSLQDWNGPLAYKNNISGTNILTAKLVRGGTASPSALLFSQDQVTRISFNPGGSPYFWTADLVSSQVSCLNGQNVVQVGNQYFWAGANQVWYQYNGTVSELKNDQNTNFFFDNLDYNNRSKTWSIVIPRWGEWWIFYVHKNLGQTECNNALIYNYHLQRWFDTGFATGAQRSCGYFSESFPYPYMASWTNTAEFLTAGTVVAQPTGGTAPAPTTSQFYVGPNDLTPNFPPGAFVTLTPVAGSAIYRIVSSKLYYISATQNATLVQVDPPIGNLPRGTSVFPSNAIGYPIYQHEVGTDQVDGGKNVQAIYSSFTTNLAGFVIGDLSQDALVGIEKNMNIVRIEPNFTMPENTTMNAYVLGQAYGSSNTVTVIGPKQFSNSVDFLDWQKAEFRLIKFKFESNQIGGDYQMGKVLARCDFGAGRPSGA